MIIAPIHESNDCHNPGGSAVGGQFCGPGASDTSALDAREAKIRREAVTDEERTYARRLAQAELAQEADAADGDSKDASTRGGVYTPERAAIHDQIIQQYLTDRMAQVGHVLPHGLETPNAILMAGVPAAGKTSASAGLDLSDYVIADADVMKGYLKPYGYNGANAIEFQRESTDLADKVVAFALANRMNIFNDRVLKDAGSTTDPLGAFDGALGRLAAYKAAGYTTEMRLVTVPVETSIARSIRRFLDTGRYVPGSLIRSMYLPDGRSKPERSVRLALASSVNGTQLVDSAWMYNGVTKEATKLR